MGYPIVVVIALALGMESRVFALSIRGFIVFLCLLAGLTFIVSRVRARLPMALIFFLLAYLARMFADQGRFQTSQEDLLYYLGVTVAPVAAVSLLAMRWDDKRAAQTMAVLGIVGSVMIIAAAVFDFSGWRSTTANSLGRFSYDVLNAITVGNVGAMTVIAAACVFRVQRSTLMAAGVAVGMIVLIMGLSRGPIVSLAACALAYLWLTRRWKSLIVTSIIGLVFVFTSAVGGLLEVLRLNDLGYDDSSAARVMVIRWSIADFWQSPFFGSSYLEPRTEFYPHNLFVEAALALGIGGLLAAIYLSVKGFRISVWGMRGGDIFLPMTFIYWLVEAQFSGAVWSNVMLWLSMAVLLAHQVRVRQSSPALASEPPRLAAASA